MEKERIAYLHHHYLNGTLSIEEFEEWNILLRDTENLDYLSELMDSNWDRMTTNDQIHLRDNRSAEILAYISAQPYKKRLKTNWHVRTVAAAVFLLIGLGMYFYIIQKDTVLKQSSFAYDVKPGKQGATLTLANGKKIRLSDVSNGEIANQAGISVSKTADGELVYEIKDSGTDPNQINTLSTAKGETYILKLPDKSRVWMNAASSLTYSATLKKNGKRSVKLEGEAYFEIAKDPLHPFVVETKTQQIQVLGTHFNVNSYADEAVAKTTLLEGSVQVDLMKGDKKVVLKPGQQSLLSNGQIRIQDVDTDESVAWKNGYFQFDGKNLETALLEVSRWYNIEIEYKDNSLRKQALAGSISKYENVNNILKTMELTGALKFSVSGRKVVVERN
ncbi:MAG: FecR domain-containing protein [Pedobacter sp.]|uniref:FecR family protein n=1 Tax=Pedobacter sp. TaxID=1411316 RepID=UPI003565F513